MITDWDFIGAGLVIGVYILFPGNGDPLEVAMAFVKPMKNSSNIARNSLSEKESLVIIWKNKNYFLSLPLSYEPQ